MQAADQPPVEGLLSGLGDDGLLLTVGKEERRLPLRSLLSVRPTAGTAPSAKYNTLIQLADQSTLAATDYQVRGGQATVTLVGGVKLTMPTRAIRAVRFQAPGDHDEKTGKQWSEIVASQAAADLLAIRKKGSLDYLEGVLQDLDADNLTFELDKQPIVVKRPKIEGLVYYHAATDPLPEAICEITIAGGTRLAARSVRGVDGKLQITTPTGVELRFPWQQVAQLDFSAGKVRYLSDLQPEAQEYWAYFPLKDPPESVIDFFRPRQDRGLEQAPLRLDGKSYAKGLTLHSRTLLAYRLPGEFSRFEAVVGIDDSVREGGNADVKILGDGKPLWQGRVRGTGPAEAVSLPVAGIRRLEILVDFGEDLDIADQVDLCEAKVTK